MRSVVTRIASVSATIIWIVACGSARLSAPGGAGGAGGTGGVPATLATGGSPVEGGAPDGAIALDAAVPADGGCAGAVTCQAAGGCAGRPATGAGALLQCGDCPPPQTCGGGGSPGVCGGDAGCVPLGCAARVSRAAPPATAAAR